MASYTTAVSPTTPVLQASSLLLSRGSWRPAVAFRPSAAVKCRRRALNVTCALPEKERPPVFSIPPTALLCPAPPPDGKERWDIKEEEDRVTLWLQVPGLSESDIEVIAGEDVLEIKRVMITTAQRTAAPGVDAHGVGSFHIRLLLTKEYDGKKVTADLKAGMLEVTIPKNKQGLVRHVKLGAKAPTDTTPTAPGGSGAGNESGGNKKDPQSQETKPGQIPPGRQNTQGAGV